MIVYRDAVRNKSPSRKLQKTRPKYQQLQMKPTTCETRQQPWMQASLSRTTRLQTKHLRNSEQKGPQRLHHQKVFLKSPPAKPANEKVNVEGIIVSKDVVKPNQNVRATEIVHPQKLPHVCRGIVPMSNPPARSTASANRGPIVTMARASQAQQPPPAKQTTIALEAWSAPKKNARSAWEDKVYAKKMRIVIRPPSLIVGEDFAWSQINLQVIVSPTAIVYLANIVPREAASHAEANPNANNRAIANKERPV